MSDLTERLRKITVRIADRYGTDGSDKLNDPDLLYFAAHEAADALEAAEAKLAAIDALHRYSPDSDGCFECFRLWPCPTHLVLHPKEEQ